jgi:hypothetical protein
MSRAGAGDESQRRKSDEAQRLAAALRDNLARRKAQARARAAAQDNDTGETVPAMHRTGNLIANG